MVRMAWHARGQGSNPLSPTPHRSAGQHHCSAIPSHPLSRRRSAGPHPGRERLERHASTLVNSGRPSTSTPQPPTCWRTLTSTSTPVDQPGLGGAEGPGPGQDRAVRADPDHRPRASFPPSATPSPRSATSWGSTGPEPPASRPDDPGPSGAGGASHLVRRMPAGSKV